MRKHNIRIHDTNNKIQNLKNLNQERKNRDNPTLCIRKYKYLSEKINKNVKPIPYISYFSKKNLFEKSTIVNSIAMIPRYESTWHDETKRNETKTGSSRYFASQTHSFGFLLSTGRDNERRKETERRRLAIIAPSANSLACFKGGRYAFAEAARERQEELETYLPR